MTREEIESVFREGTLELYPDPAHSVSETRYVGMGGPTRGGTSWWRSRTREIEKQRLIRPISARYMHAKGINTMKRKAKTLPRSYLD